MNQFGGSLRFVSLTTALALIRERASTGRLRIAYLDGQLAGEIVLVDGQMVAAALGVEQGLTAIEAMVVGLADGEFNFVAEPVSEPTQPLIAAHELSRYLEALTAERERVLQRIPSLRLVPRLAGTPAEGAAHEQVALRAGALRLIPALAAGQSIAQLAEQRGLGRTVRGVAELLEAGVVCLDGPAASQSRPQVAAVSARQSTTDHVRRDMSPGDRREPVRLDGSPGTVRAAVRQAALAQAGQRQPSLAPGGQQVGNSPTAARFEENRARRGPGGWRRAVMRFFIADDTADQAAPEAQQSQQATQAPRGSPVLFHHAS